MSLNIKYLQGKRIDDDGGDDDDDDDGNRMTTHFSVFLHKKFRDNIQYTGGVANSPVQKGS